MAGQVGLDMAINDRWFVNASAWLIDIDTDVHTAVGTINTSIDPVAFMFGVGYASDDKRGRCLAMTT
jgi:outer membrane protein